MTKTDIAKKITKIVVGSSVSYVVTSVIANNVAPEKPHQKVETVVGGMVIGGIVANHAQSCTDQKIDDLILWWKTNVTH